MNKKRQFFVAHEFNKSNLRKLRNTIEKAFERTAFEPVYPDREIESNKPILRKIEEFILSTEFGIYDMCSDKEGMIINPNVILELGIALGANKDYYITVKKDEAKDIFHNISDLAGFERIEYSSFSDLAAQLKAKVIPRYEIEKEIRTFWMSFIKEGGTIIVGTQTVALEGGSKRNIIGENDDVANNKLSSFLYSIASSSIVKAQKIKVKHLPMPVATGISKRSKKMIKYLDSIENIFHQTVEKNFVLIGMPASNPATELIISKMYNLRPFDPNFQKKLKTGSLINDLRRKFESTVYIYDDEKGMGIYDIEANQIKTSFVQKQKSCGIIIKTNMWGKNIIIIAGFNGIATIAGVELLISQTEDVDTINKNLESRKFKNGFLFEVYYDTPTEKSLKPLGFKIRRISLLRD